MCCCGDGNEPVGSVKCVESLTSFGTCSFSRTTAPGVCVQASQMERKHQIGVVFNSQHSL
jgi:hypothetical protein